MPQSFIFALVESNPSKCVSATSALALTYCKTPQSDTALKNELSSDASIQGMTKISASDQWVDDYLQAFQADSELAMEQTPPKWDSEGKAVQTFQVFTDKEVESKDYVVKKDQFRVKVMCKGSKNQKDCEAKASGGRAPIEYNDRAENLVDNGRNMLRTLEQMESKNLLSARLSEHPWSDDYWPIYSGILGKRYGDSGWGRHKEWDKHYKYAMETKPASSVSDLDKVSPSEKNPLKS